MRINRNGLAATALAVCAVALSLDETAADKALLLFSPEEAAQLRIEGEAQAPALRLRAAPQGPLISVQVPSVQKTSSGLSIQTGTPTSLSVLFEQNRAPVDMASLEVVARKGIFSKSLTDRLKPYVTGTSLNVDEVDIPAGKFLIEIAIADQEGRATTQSYQLLVEK